MQSQSQTITESQLLALLQPLLQSPSPPPSALSTLHCHLLHPSILTPIISLLISKQQPPLMKKLLCSLFNPIVQNLLNRYGAIRVAQNARKSRFGKDHEDLKRDIIAVTTKLERAIENVNVSVWEKDRLVYFQLRLYARSREDWEASRLGSKMDFYFRKEYVIIAQAYFRHMWDMSFTAKEKIQFINKSYQYFASISVKSFNRILKGQGLPASQQKSGGYQDFACSMGAIVRILKNMFMQHSNKITLQLCNNQPFLILLKTLIQQYQQCSLSTLSSSIATKTSSLNHSHPHKQISLWKSLTLQTLTLLTNYIGYNKIEAKCQKFLEMMLRYVVYIYGTRFGAAQGDGQMARGERGEKDGGIERAIGDYLGLFDVCIRYRLMARVFVTGIDHINTQCQCQPVLHPVPSTLSFNQKIHLLKTLFVRLHSCVVQKCWRFMKLAQSKKEKFHQDQNQFKQIFQFLCSFEEYQQHQDEQEQDFMLRFAMFVQRIVSKYADISMFIRNLLLALFYQICGKQFSEIQSTYIQQQLKLLQYLPQILPSTCSSLQTLSFTLSLLLTLYRPLSQSPQFISQYVTKFTYKLVQIDNLTQKLTQLPQCLILLLLFVKNYLPDIPLAPCAPYSKISSWPFLPLLSSLPSLPKSLTSLTLPLVQTHNNLSLSITSLLSAHNPTYSHTSTTKYQYPQLFYPMQCFQKIQGQIGVEYFPDLYGGDGFKMLEKGDEYKKEGNAVNRVRVVLQKMIQFGEKGCNGDGNHVQYMHGVFRVMNRVVACEEYSSIFQHIFNWINNIISNSKWLKQFQQDTLNLCLTLLKKSSTMLGLSSESLFSIWQAVHYLLSNFTYDLPPPSPLPSALPSFASQQEAFNHLSFTLTHKYLILLSILPTYKIPFSLLQIVIKIAIENLEKIQIGIGELRDKMDIVRVRPYQEQQMGMLVALHRVLQSASSYPEFSEILPTLIPTCLDLFYRNLLSNLINPQQFNYITGKYNILLLLFLHYNFLPFSHFLHQKSIFVSFSPNQNSNLNINSKILEESNKKKLIKDFQERVYYEIFYNEKNYRIGYDVQMFIKYGVGMVRRIWAKRDKQWGDMRLMVKYAHFAVGGFIICLDRVYEKHRYNLEQQLQIPSLSSFLLDPVLTTDNRLSLFLSTLTVHNAISSFDQFSHFRSLFVELKSNVKTRNWFFAAMNMYIKSQVYYDSYMDLIQIRKIWRKGGVVYRVVRKPVGM